MNKRRTLNHSIIYILASILQALFPFILLPILTRYSSQSNFGLLMVLISMATILSFVFTFGVPAILTRELIFDKANIQLYKNSAVKFQSLLILVSLLSLGLSRISWVAGNLSLVLLVISVSLALSVIQIQLSILRSEFRVNTYVLLAISSTSFPLLITTISALLGSKTNLFVFAVSTFLVAGIVQLKKSFLLPNYKDFASLGGLIAIGYPMIFHSVSISFFQYGDKVAGYLGFGSELAAEITIISLFMTAPMLLLSSINNAWLPSVLERFKKNENQGYLFSNKVSKQLSILIFALSCAMIVSISKVINLFVPNSYNQIDISKSIIIGITFSPLYILYLQNTHIVTITKKFKTLAKITPIAALCQFFFTFILVKSIGLTAPAIGMLVALSFQAFLISIAVGDFKKLSKAPLISTITLSLFSYTYLYLL